MGLFSNLFNKLFRREKVKLLQEENRQKAVPKDLPHEETERKDDFNEKLQMQTIKQDELTMDMVVDAFVEKYELQSIAKNPRGRELLKESLQSGFEALCWDKQNFTNKTFSRGEANYLIENTCCQKDNLNKGTITFKDNDVYLNPNNKSTGAFEPGERFTTISADENGKLTLSEKTKYEYDRTTSNPVVNLSGRKREFDEYGIETRREYESVSKNVDKRFVNIVTIDTALDAEKRREICERRDGIYVESFIQNPTYVGDRTLPVHNERKFNIINSENGIDDIVVSSDEGYKSLEDAKESLTDVEKYKEDAIKESKYKEALADMLGVTNKELENSEIE